MKENKNLMFEELESVEELGAFYDFMDGVGKGLAIGTGVVAIIAVVTLLGNGNNRRSEGVFTNE